MFTQLPHAVHLSLHGPDAERYLQGRLTQDVAKCKEETPVQSLLLSPQGKVLGMFLIVRTASGFEMLLPAYPKGAEAFLDDLLRFKVADQVNADIQTRTVIAFDSDISFEQLAPLFPSAPSESPCQFLQDDSATLFLGDAKHPIHYLSFESGRQSAVMEHFDSLGLAEDAHHFDKLRTQHGVPLYGKDVTEKNVAPDIPLEPFVSFSKGCYAGQEVVEMASARGKPNKHFVSLSCEEPVSLTEGAALTSGESDKSIGSLTSGTSFDTPPRFRGLGFLKAAHAELDTVQCGAVTLTVSKLS